MTEAEISFALKDHLASMPSLPPVAWPNEDESGVPPADGSPYFVVSHFRNRPDRIDIGGNYHRRAGIFQVSVATGEGRGSREADELADALASHFPVDLRLSSIRVIERPTVGQGMPVEGEWRVPVSIYYEVL